MSGRALVIAAPAKINLTLRVGPRRADGFHEVTTVLQSIALADRLTMSAGGGKAVALDVRVPGVPVDRSNLVHRALVELWREMGRRGEPGGLSIRLDKRIPVAAGLGGGSADAAAAMVGANLLWRAGLTAEALARAAARVGSDVPFFLVGGTAIGTGRGERVYPLADVRPLDVVIISPAFGVSAADAYRWLDLDGAKAARGRRASRVDLGWPTGSLVVENDLEPAVTRRHPEVGRMVRACLRAGARAAAMSGSGSAVFGLFDRGRGRDAAARLERPGWRVFASRTLGRRPPGGHPGL